MKEVYVCKRMRLLSHLKKCGFSPFKVLPDAENPKFNVWLFQRTEKLDEELDKYFKRIKNQKQ